VPLNAMMHRIGSRRELQYIVVAIDDMEMLTTTRDAVRALMVERHGRQDFSIADTAKSAFGPLPAPRRAISSGSFSSKLS
jgi:hypothetical protein